MIVSHYWPNPGMKVFQRHARDCTFLDNRCDKTADLIYCGSVSQIGRALKAKREFNKPLVCWVWDIACDWREWCRTEREFLQNRKRDAIVNRFVSGLRQCDKVLSASRFTQKVLKERFGIESEHLYFYIKTDEINAVKTPKGNGHIIQISRYALNKRFDVTVKACQGLDNGLVCVGTGDCVHLGALASNMGVNAQFYRNIGREKTISLLKQAKILVSPSVFEGWGITPIEAIHCGKPILLSDLEVFRELWGDNALYHKRDDVVDMHEKLKLLLADRRMQRKIVDTCRPLISEFTPQRFAERWRRAIE